LQSLQTIDHSKSKRIVYEELLAQIKALTTGEKDLIANLGNICALLKYEMSWFWVGFYFVKKEELVLGTFQGPLACTRIKKGKGVCGSSWQKNETIVVPNVELFKGHIACSSLTQSEIVVPVRDKEGNCIGVLDVDSEKLTNFDEEDKNGLEKIVEFINQLF